MKKETPSSQLKNLVKNSSKLGQVKVEEQKLADLRKRENELKAQDERVLEQLRLRFTQGQAQPEKEMTIEDFLAGRDQAAAPVFDVLGEQRAKILGRLKTCQGLIEKQERAIVEAKAELTCDIREKMRGLYVSQVRELVKNALRHCRIYKEIQDFILVGERAGVVAGAAPFALLLDNFGAESDPTSRISECLRRWTEDGIITEKERQSIVAGGDLP